MSLERKVSRRITCLDDVVAKIWLPSVRRHIPMPEAGLVYGEGGLS